MARRRDSGSADAPANPPGKPVDHDVEEAPQAEAEDEDQERRPWFPRRAREPSTFQSSPAERRPPPARPARADSGARCGAPLRCPTGAASPARVRSPGRSDPPSPTAKAASLATEGGAPRHAARAGQVLGRLGIVLLQVGEKAVFEAEPPALGVVPHPVGQERSRRLRLSTVPVQDQRSEDVGVLEARIELGQRAEEGLGIGVATVAQTVAAVVLDRLEPAASAASRARPKESGRTQGPVGKRVSSVRSTSCRREEARPWLTRAEAARRTHTAGRASRSPTLRGAFMGRLRA